MRQAIGKHSKIGWEVGGIGRKKVTGEMEKDFYPNSIQSSFLKIQIDGAVSLEGGSLFHYLTTFI